MKDNKTYYPKHIPLTIKTERTEKPARFRTRFNNHLRIQQDFKQPSLTKQSFKDEHDINNIVRKSNKDPMSILHLVKEDPSYGDFSQATDYQEAMNLVVKANEQFEALSAPIRERFQNNPSEFLKFASDPANGPEMVKLGMAIKRPQPANPEPISPKLEDPKEPKAPKKEKKTDE